MNLLEYVGLIAIVSVAIYSVKKISVSCYRKKAMREWVHEQRKIDRRKSQNRQEMRWE